MLTGLRYFVVAPNKWTFWIYSDGINRTKGPFVMFMGHIGVPTEDARQR